MKYSKYILILFILFSCKTNKFRSDEKLCQILIDLYNKDQFYRGDTSLLPSPFFKVFDSIMLSEGISKDEYMKLSKDKQLAFGRRVRKISDKLISISKKTEDSLMNKQIELDIINTEKLLDIVKNRGYPDMKKLKCSGYSAPVLIFVHSPEKYWKELKKAIEEEKKYNRISEGDYKYINWHIEGRKGHPFDLSKQKNKNN